MSALNQEQLDSIIELAKSSDKNDRDRAMRDLYKHDKFLDSELDVERVAYIHALITEGTVKGLQEYPSYCRNLATAYENLLDETAPIEDHEEETEIYEDDSLKKQKEWLLREPLLVEILREHASLLRIYANYFDSN
jgi:hypothetical protein